MTPNGIGVASNQIHWARPESTVRAEERERCAARMQQLQREYEKEYGALLVAFDQAEYAIRAMGDELSLIHI